MSGEDVKGVQDLMEPDNPGQVLQPCTAAAATERHERHAGVVDAEAQNATAAEVAVLLAAVSDGEEFLGLNVLTPYRSRRQPREVQGASKDIAPTKIARRVGLDRDDVDGVAREQNARPDRS